MNHKQNIRRSIQGSLFVICCSLIVGADSNPSRLITKLVEESGQAHSLQLPPVVVSPELKLEILSIRDLGNDVLEVKMKNRYTKDITAVAATVGDAQSFRRDYIYAELETSQKLAPGATDDFSYTPSRVSRALPQVVVSAVIFSDGTSEGDQAEVREILDKRLGFKIQLDRINPNWQRLGRAKSAQIRGELKRLKSIADGLSINQGDGLPVSPGLEHGLAGGRLFILHYLSKLETVLESQRIESFYHLNGVLQTVQHSGEEDFRNSLPRIQRDFQDLASRLQVR